MQNYFVMHLIKLLITIMVLINIAQSANNADDNTVVEDRTTGVLDFIVQVCSNVNNCQPVTLGLVVDNNWRGVYHNLCYDPKQCDMVIFKKKD